LALLYRSPWRFVLVNRFACRGIDALWRGATVTALAMSIAAAPIAHGSQEPPPADEITLREALVIDRVGQYGRAAVHTDAIESMIVQGSWITPKAGDSIATPDGAQHAWIAVEAGEDGTLRHEALRGGYALFTY